MRPDKYRNLPVMENESRIPDPHRNLYSAILARALRDLEVQEYARSAEWFFMSDDYDNDSHITFIDCCNYLDLSVTEIRRRIKYARINFDTLRRYWRCA